MNKKIGHSIVGAVLAGVILTGYSSCPPAGNAKAAHSAKKDVNADKLRQWCLNARPNEPETWVWRYHDRRTGETGYIRGTDNADIWRRLHKGQIILHCR